MLAYTQIGVFCVERREKGMTLSRLTVKFLNSLGKTFTFLRKPKWSGIFQRLLRAWGFRRREKGIVESLGLAVIWCNLVGKTYWIFEEQESGMEET